MDLLIQFNNYLGVRDIPIGDVRVIYRSGGEVQGKKKSSFTLSVNTTANRDNFNRIIKQITMKLPKQMFVGSGSLKFVCTNPVAHGVTVWNDDGKKDIAFPPTPENNQKNEDLFPTDGRDVKMIIMVTGPAFAVSLSYWETYVDPWFDVPIILNRPNARRTDEILAFWSDVAGKHVTLQNLEQTIIDAIVSGAWDDEIWIPVQELLVA